MLPDQFKTKRLTIRNWRSDLAKPSKRRQLEDALTAILSPAVLAHLPPPLQLTADSGVGDWVSARAVESDVLLVSLIGSNTLIGLLIIAPGHKNADLRNLHIGYLLAQSAWGKGYASELLSGLVTALKPETPVQLIGGVSRDNPASGRVLKKAGFQKDETLSTPDTDVFVRLTG